MANFISKQSSTEPCRVLNGSRDLANVEKKYFLNRKSK
jgi:hypothetical protein